jgi:arsenite-transporting ATPase
MARLLLFGGKGGVGKTTTSTATAVGLARAGLKVLLVSSDPAHSTSDSLGVELGSEPTEVAGIPGLWGLELDPEAKISDMLPNISESMAGPMAGMLGSDALNEINEMKEEVSTSEMILPGLDEAMAFDELLENPNWDVIVFDTAPTGHTLRFLALPEIIETWADRIIRMHRVTGGIRSILFGRKEGDKMREELERFRRRVLHVRRILCDPRLTRFTLVTIPEKMGVNESIRAYESLMEFNLPVSGCVINRKTPDIDHQFIKRRREMEEGYCQELEERLSDLVFKHVELLEGDVHGFDRLDEMSKLLHGEIELSDGLGPFDIGLGLQVNRGSWREGDEVQVHLPAIEREELSLRSEEGVLMVGINGREHEIEHHSPVKASQVGAKLNGDVLHLSFPEK